MTYQKLEPMTVGDLFPFHYFRFWETYTDLNGDLREKASDLGSDYSSIKICIRKKDNRDDPNDHTKDDIYADMNVDIANIAHYVWQAGDTDNAGTYVLRFHLTRTTGESYHPPMTYEFDIVNKMPSKLRAIS